MDETEGVDEEREGEEEKETKMEGNGDGRVAVRTHAKTRRQFQAFETVEYTDNLRHARPLNNH